MRALLLPILLALSALFAQPLWADTAASIQILDKCLHALAPEAGTGIEQLREICPDLERTINESPLRDQLPEHWQEQLDRNGIADISALLQRYQSQAQSAVPRVATLYQVAQSLNQPQPRHSWWQDLKEWLRRQLLAPDNSESSWMTRWWPDAPLLMRTIFYGLLAAVLLMALWIIRGELKAAAAGARATRARARAPLAPSPAGARPLTPEDIDAAPLRERPALLLRLLVQALLQSGRLHGERSLTHRELAVRSAFDDAEQHGRFERIALLAERVLYGPNQPIAQTGPEASIDALNDGRQLYAQLLAGRGPPR